MADYVQKAVPAASLKLKRVQQPHVEGTILIALSIMVLPAATVAKIAVGRPAVATETTRVLYLDPKSKEVDGVRLERNQIVMVTGRSGNRWKIELATRGQSPTVSEDAAGKVTVIWPAGTETRVVWVDDGPTLGPKE